MAGASEIKTYFHPFERERPALGQPPARKNALREVILSRRALKLK
jgi:hypothetical protein